MATHASRAVFLSCAREDATAAGVLAESLRGRGVEVWFDNGERRGGEEWVHQIRRQVDRCELFMPVISEHTQARREGNFRFEWKLADERTRVRATGTSFLLPVSIDATNERTALVPDSFLRVPWARLPGGETPAAFCDQVKRLLTGGGAATPAASPGAAPSVPDYEMLRLIGQGSYGDVWLARSVTGLYCAIKVVWRERFADAVPFEREFHGLKEFAALSRGEGIQLALLHVGRNDTAGFFYYVMELADDAERGREIDPARYVPLTLAEVRVRNGRVPLAECLAYGVALARVLAGLHAHGLVHRDIKPSNVILVGGVPKLADIGLVTATSAARTFVGTEGFVPPEGPGSPRADVFALGKLLYEISTGLDRQQFPQLPSEGNRVPDHAALLKLHDVVLRACAPLPEKRHADGRALLSDLTALQAGRPVRRLNRGRRLVLLAATAVVALGLGWLGLRPPAVRPSAPYPEEDAPVAEAGLPEVPGFHQSVVVLPLENLSADTEHAWFADAMHMEIIAALGRVGDLRVIGRDTALALKRASPPLSLADLASKVGVANVITGGVQMQGQTVRIALELRRASDEAVLWSLPSRDRDFKETMALQSEIAEEVARALQAREAKGSFAAAQFTTKNPQAYELFARSHAAFWEAALTLTTPLGWMLREEGIKAAEQALQLDPGFMSAASLLASHNILAYQTSTVPAEQLRYANEAKRWGLETQRLGPGGAGDGALAHYYIEVERDCLRGLDLANSASRALPNEATCIFRAGLALMGLGRWEEALARFDHARSIDPLKANFPRWQLWLLARLRRESEFAALAATRFGSADRDALRRRLGDDWFILSGELPDKPETLGMPSRALWLWRARRFDEHVTALKAELDEPTIARTGAFLRFELLRQKCLTLRRLGRTAEADEATSALLSLLEMLRPEREVDICSKYRRRTWAYACAGRRDDAITYGRECIRILVASNRIEDRWAQEIALARIHAHFGQTRECVELLTRLLRVPSGITVPVLRVEPDWDNVREDAGFKALLADPMNSAPLGAESAEFSHRGPELSGEPVTHEDDD